MTKDEIDKLIGYDPAALPQDQISTVEYVTRFLLATAVSRTNAGMRPDPDDQHFRCLTAHGSLAAACARLLVALEREENPTDTAWEIADGIDDGEALYCWAVAELNKRNIKVPA
jgi:hypothetical protein